MAAGADGLFLEVHPDPDRALSDRAVQLDPERAEALLRLARAPCGGRCAGVEVVGMKRRAVEPVARPRRRARSPSRCWRPRRRRSAACSTQLDERFDRAVELLRACQGRVVCTGMGKSGIVMQKVAATLSSTGTPALFLHPAEAVHGDLGDDRRGRRGARRLLLGHHRGAAAAGARR